MMRKERKGPAPVRTAVIKYVKIGRKLLGSRSSTIAIKADLLSKVHEC